MSAKELVMAIVCKPLSSNDILEVEKENNVVIFRRMLYDKQAGCEALISYIKKLSQPLKYLFIFGLNDCLLINGTEDMETALNRLVSM